ncbi:WD40 repeat-like protein [Schizopora paradoxa]|uniref:WD40 repeat-like protein n=1 Tax=Schizopora paradoxa TaxID=27342 RepID=A0A0H2S8U2_9AGAM|nr:WD40 repeat-like protein [Schizopora paradoxa]
MRIHHTAHALSGFPVFSAAFVADDRLVLGGGGGSSRSGVKNKLRLYNVPSDGKLELLNELELGKDEDSPMSMAADVYASRVLCGINSSTEQIAQGINKNCRLYDATGDEIDLLESTGTLDTPEGEEESDYQKVTVLSPGRTLACISGTKRLSLLSYPSLSRAACDLITKDEFYDASFSSTKLAVATNKDFFIYSLPAAEVNEKSSSSGPKTRSKAKGRKNSKLEEQELLEAFSRPDVTGDRTGNTTLRACRFNPVNDDIIYTVSNTAPIRTKGKSKPKQGYICKWNTTTWKIVKVRKAGEKGITCFDVSPNGKYLAVGSADCTIAILDANTLTPLLTILKAHDFPPTVVKFNPSSKLLVSGSADNSVRLVTIPGGLAGSKWSFVNVMIFILLTYLILRFVFSGILPL